MLGGAGRAGEWAVAVGSSWTCRLFLLVTPVEARVGTR